MLLVIALLTETAQGCAQDDPFAAEQPDAQKEENPQRCPGEVLVMLEEHEAEQDSHVQYTGQPEPGELLAQGDGPEGLVHACGGVGKQQQRRQADVQKDVLGQGHGNDPAREDIEAEPERHRQGEEQDKPVAGHVDPVEQLLVLFNHI